MNGEEVSDEKKIIEKLSPSDSGQEMALLPFAAHIRKLPGVDCLADSR